MSSDETQHVSVMLAETLALLEPAPGRIIVDGTLGGGGHARALAERVAPGGLVIALDRDANAVERAQKTLAGLPVRAIQENFAQIPAVLKSLRIEQVHGVLLDLGLSSDQLADASRGFSFDAEGPLDLRFDPTAGEPAWRLIERLPAEELANLIYRFGEERLSRRIARRIVEARRQTPVRTAAQLARIVRGAYPRRPGRERIDPATRTFQALRIAVNRELSSLETALQGIPGILAPGGCLVVISFHSLEDRIVKEAFRSDARYVIVTKKPLRAGDEEVARNPRARSAKMRAARRSPSAAG